MTVAKNNKRVMITMNAEEFEAIKQYMVAEGRRNFSEFAVVAMRERIHRNHGNVSFDAPISRR